ncbi:MAG: hypothetical protein K2Z81_20435 [Cyanobacteria bacterium]|nr:hypothetical protein [Cyanobacteriota bacterium]
MSLVVIHSSLGRAEVDSMAPFLRDSLSLRNFMDEARMTDEDRKDCRWIGFGAGKGVTSPKRDTTVFAVPTVLTRGMHGELVQEFSGVDPLPRCYEPDHDLGFDDFVRWIYFANPNIDDGVFGLDFSMIERPTAGVADSVLRVATVAKVAARHGIPVESELALLNPRMVEPPEAFDWRMSRGLHRVKDWIVLGEQLFGANGLYCPRCGNSERRSDIRYCPCCGCKPQIILEREAPAVKAA